MPALDFQSVKYGDNGVMGKHAVWMGWDGEDGKSFICGAIM